MNGNSVRYTVTDEEKKLVLVVRMVEYGEVIGALLPENEPNDTVLLSPQERALLEFIREGHREVDRIDVHDGIPRYATVTGEQDGFRYRKRRKL